MTERSKGRIETPHCTLVEVTIPMLIADQAYAAALDEHQEMLAGYVRGKISDDDLHRSHIHFSQSRDEVKRLLDADIVPSWPPLLDHLESRKRMIRYLESNPEPGWGMWYVLMKCTDHKRPLALGNVGFKGPPSNEGSVELDYYSFVAPFDASGTRGTEAVGILVTCAFEDPRVQRVMAQIREDEIVPSQEYLPYSSEYCVFQVNISILEKNGFRRASAGSEPGSLLFQRYREAPRS